MVHREYLPRFGDLSRLVWGLYGAPTPWFASILGIHACRTCGGVIIFKLPVDDAQLFHALEVLEREVSIIVVEAQKFS